MSATLARVEPTTKRPSAADRVATAITSPASPEGTVFAELMQQAEMALASGFLPKTIRTAAQAVTIAMTGRELGLPVMASLRMLSIIEGKPVFSAEGTLALVYSKVRGARVDVIESTETRAVVEAQRPGGAAARFAFSIEDARRAGLVGKDNWRKYPGTMLRWRAILNACRATFPEATLGIVTPDEAEEIAASVPAAAWQTPAQPSEASRDMEDAPPDPSAASPADRLANRFAGEISDATTADLLPAIGAAIAQAERDGALGGPVIKALRAAYAKRRAHLRKHADDAPAADPAPAPEAAVDPGDGYREDIR